MVKKLKLVKLTCLRCGYEWLPRVPSPAVCPRCKCRDYDEPVRSDQKANQ